NLISLKLALKRIKVPDQIFQIILNILHNREFNIITHYKITDPIIINNGFGQEKTLALLLWMIFYNPMVNKISKTSDLNTKILAYMNNVALVSKNLQSLQKATDI